MPKEAIKKVIQTAYVDGLQNEGDADKIDSIGGDELLYEKSTIQREIFMRE